MLSLPSIRSIASTSSGALTISAAQGAFLKLPSLASLEGTEIQFFAVGIGSQIDISNLVHVDSNGRTPSVTSIGGGVVQSNRLVSGIGMSSARSPAKNSLTETVTPVLEVSTSQSNVSKNALPEENVAAASSSPATPQVALLADSPAVRGILKQPEDKDSKGESSDATGGASQDESLQRAGVATFERHPSTWRMDGQVVDSLMIKLAQGDDLELLLLPEVGDFDEIVETNRSLGAISGAVWLDSDQDGHVDPREPRLSGRRVFLDLDGDGRLSPDEPVAVSDSLGVFQLTDLPYQEYQVCLAAASEKISIDGASATRSVRIKLREAHSGGIWLAETPARSDIQLAAALEQLPTAPVEQDQEEGPKESIMRPWIAIGVTAAATLALTVLQRRRRRKEHELSQFWDEPLDERPRKGDVAEALKDTATAIVGATHENAR